ncbi:LytR/AlgR family response regulator transcription factor [Gemmatirosa kalamazoonensis]|nr:LytTR family DNA-binding domain-containing protein [Gemmatirosa kalamazoonensis]
MPNTPITVLIAEDEPVPRRRLARLLGEEPDLRVVAQCAGGREAVERIKEESPDLVFLDVQMPDLNGFQVIEAVGPERMPTVVFVTAYDAYAVRAFEVHAVDYLLKPYDQARFRTALDRARQRLRTLAGAGTAPVEDDERLRALIRSVAAELVQGAASSGAALNAPNPDLHPEARVEPRAEPRPERSAASDHIAVRVDGALRIVRLDEIDWFESEGNYVRVHVGRQSYLVRQTSQHLETQLDGRQFARIHRRYLVNLARVHEVQPWFGGDAVVVLKDGTKLRLSRTFREQFHARFLGES